MFLNVFKINIHTWESYFYSDALEGFLSLNELFSSISPKVKESVDNFPYFNIYHPNHPLLHLLTLVFHKVFLFCGIYIDTLSITQFINSTFSSLTLSVVFYFSKSQGLNNFKSILLLLFFVSTNSFLYQSTSGEVYLAPLFFITLCFSLFIENKKCSILNSSLLALGFSFHILTILFLFPYILLICLYHSKSDRSKWISFSILFFFLSGILTYIIPISLMLKEFSIEYLLDVIFIYTNQFGFWISEAKDKSFIFETISAFNALASSINPSDSILIKVLNYLFIIAPFAIFIFLRDKLTLTMTLGLLTFFSFIVYFLSLSEVIDYWILTLPLYFFSFFVLLKKTHSKIVPLILSIIVGVNFYLNFSKDILVKNFISKDYFISNSHRDLLSKYDSIYLYSSNSFDHSLLRQLWHLNRTFKNVHYIFDLNNLNLLKGQNSILLTNTEIFMKPHSNVSLAKLSSRKIKEDKKYLKESIGKILDQDWILHFYEIKN